MDTDLTPEELENKRKKAAYMKQWTEKNRDRLLAEKKRYASDPAVAKRIKEYKRSKYLKNRLQILAKSKQDYALDREASRAKRRAYLNRPDVKARHQTKLNERYSTDEEYRNWRRGLGRAWYAKNRIECMKRQRQRERADPIAHRARLKKWRSGNLRGRLAQALRRRIRSALVCANTHKKHTFLELIGCTPEFLKSYLESKFLPGMSWDNYGFRGFHIDHIRPCASFDLTDPAQQLACFHYTNLQPLWAKDNLEKGSRNRVIDPGEEVVQTA